jgi:hypothetical protein
MPAKVLGGLEEVPAGIDPRKELVRWLTSSDNQMFSRNLANRIWAQLLGRGVVDPIDDFRVSNPPTNPALLDALSKRLVELKFDLRGLTRDICNSRVYQLSGTPTPSNRLDTRQFSHFQMRRLRADVLLDSIVAITESPRKYAYFPEGTTAMEFFPMHTYQGGQTPEYGDSFFHTFGRAGRNTVAVSTKLQPTLSQALHLAVGDSVRDRLSAGGVVKKLVETKSTPEDIIDELFVRVLCRRPTSSEMTRVRAVVGDDVKDQAVYEDLFWSLLNSTEFLFNH